MKPCATCGHGKSFHRKNASSCFAGIDEVGTKCPCDGYKLTCFMSMAFCEHANEGVRGGVCYCPIDCGCRERMCQLSPKVNAGPSRTNWQPIATAPKDKAVLTWRGAGLMAVAENIPDYRGGYEWCCPDGQYLLNVTHWMPLPDPPVPPQPGQSVMTARASVGERFWGKVLKTEGCWLWTAVKHQNGGHGKFSVRGRFALAHRVSWAMHFGEIPKGLLVCHKCDTPACVRPDHLFLGTHDANMADKVAKGRAPYGESNHLHKLKSDVVIAIHEAVKSGDRPAEVARRFGVSSQHVVQIASASQWKHLGLPPVWPRPQGERP